MKSPKPHEHEVYTELDDTCSCGKTMRQIFMLRTGGIGGFTRGVTQSLKIPLTKGYTPGGLKTLEFDKKSDSTGTKPEETRVTLVDTQYMKWFRCETCQKDYQTTFIVIDDFSDGTDHKYTPCCGRLIIL